MRLQTGGAPLDKLSVVVPTITANAAQTEIYTYQFCANKTHPSPPLSSSHLQAWMTRLEARSTFCDGCPPLHQGVPGSTGGLELPQCGPFYIAEQAT